jgi:flagellar protein FlaG
MVGNLTSVTAEPARRSVPSVPRDPLPPGNGSAISGNPASAGKELPAPEPKAPDAAEAAQRLNELSGSTRRNLQFRVDESSGRTIITVINATTKEVVRQIPSEEVLAIARIFAAVDDLA